MTEPISVKQLESMLLNIDIPDSEIRPYLVENVEESTLLRPVVKVNPAKVVMTPLEGAIALASLNGIARWRRQQRYRRKIKGWKGLRIVSEGDSWFQFPFLLDDVIDNLFDKYAIFSLDAAGDLISDMVKQNELVSAVVQEQPDVVLLSGGGNDVLGGARLASLLPPFVPGRSAIEYLTLEFNANLGNVLKDYETLITRLCAVKQDIRIVCHSYDHAIPAQGRWLGKPLAKIGIIDQQLQRDIVRLIVDRFHDELARLASKYPNIRLVDCRHTVQSHRWHDELHPNNDGFRAVADLFDRAISEQFGVEMTAHVPDARSGAAEHVSFMPPMATQANELLATYEEPILLREIGRRKTLADVRDPAADDALLVYQTSVDAVFPAQMELGDSLAKEAASVASEVIDGTDGSDEAKVARVAASLVGFAGLPPTGTAMLAAVVVARYGASQRAASVAASQ